MATKKLQIIDKIVKTDDTLTQSGVPADSKVVGDVIDAVSTLVGETAVSEQIANAVAQKSQVQIVTWEADD